MNAPRELSADDILQPGTLDERVAQLRESEGESRLVVDSIPGFITAFTPGGELEFVNRPVVEYFGKTLEELKHWGTGGMTHPEDLPRLTPSKAPPRFAADTTFSPARIRQSLHSGSHGSTRTTVLAFRPISSAAVVCV